MLLRDLGNIMPSVSGECVILQPLVAKHQGHGEGQLSDRQQGIILIFAACLVVEAVTELAFLIGP